MEAVNVLQDLFKITDHVFNATLLAAVSANRLMFVLNVWLLIIKQLQILASYATLQIAHNAPITIIAHHAQEV